MTLSARFSQSLLAATLLTSVGCGNTRDLPADASGDPALGEATRSLVRIDVEYARTSGASDVRLDAQAYFVRYRGLDDRQVPTLLGFPPAVSLGPDRCLVIDDRAALDRALATRSAVADLALLDAGRVELRAGAEPLPLWTRHYPELVPGLTGTVYGATGSVPSAVVLGATHTIATEGGSEVGPFSVSAVAPPAFPDASVERTPAGLRLKWTPVGSGTLDVEVRSGLPRSARTVMCRVPDQAGAYTVPAAVLGAFGPATTPVRIILRNRTQTPFEIAGLGQAELNLELRETLRLGASD